MRQEQLHRPPSCSRIDMRRRQLTDDVSFICVGVFLVSLFLKSLRCGLSIIAAIVPRNFILFPCTISDTIRAFFLATELHERLANLPAQCLEISVPRTLGLGQPFRRGIIPSEFPDMSDGRADLDVD